MLSGLIVYSRIDKDNNDWFINSCIERLSKLGLSLTYKDEDEVLEYIKSNQIDFVIYRSRNYQLLEKLALLGIKCFNNSFTNKIANDKYATYEFLESNKIPCLKSNLSFDKLPLPFVMKSRDGHGGKEVYLIHEINEVKAHQIANKKYIFQEFYKNDGDLRIYVLGKKVVGAVIRNNPSDFRSNFSLGGEVKAYEPNQEIVDTATKIAKLLDADYIGVDFLNVDGHWLVNEIEDPFGARMLYKASGIDITELLATYISASLNNKSSF